MDESEKKHDRKGVLFILLGFVILLILYIVYDRQAEINDQEKANTFAQGQLSGAEQALIAVYKQAVICRPVELKMENKTITLASIECLGGRT